MSHRILKIGRLRASITRHYRGHDRKGLNKFANGWGYRLGNTVLRAWWLGDNDYTHMRQARKARQARES